MDQDFIIHINRQERTQAMEGVEQAVSQVYDNKEQTIVADVIAQIYGIRNVEDARMVIDMGGEQIGRASCRERV